MARSRYRWRHRRCRRAAPSVGVYKCAAEVDDVGHVAFPFVGSGAQQRLPELAENPGRIVDIEQDRSDAVGAHRTDAVGEHQPRHRSRWARRSSRVATPPRLGSAAGTERARPYPQLVGVGDLVRFAVGSRHGGEATVNPARNSARPLLAAARPTIGAAVKDWKSVVSRSCWLMWDPLYAV